jgi:[ribosomal protein S18]-alanine N-acetyltransferase
MTATVQPATPAHAAALAAIHAMAFPSAEAWGVDAMSVQLDLASTFGLIDTRGGMLLGRVAGDEAEVLTVAVAPAARRQGVATDLLHAALAEIRARRGRAVFLEVAPGNSAARALYQRFGFVEVGRRRGYYADGSDALVLRVKLP